MIESLGFGKVSLEALQKGVRSWVNYESAVTAASTHIPGILIVGTRDGLLHVYEMSQDRGNVLSKQKKPSLSRDEVFAEILYEHSDLVSDIVPLKCGVTATTSWDGTLLFWESREEVLLSLTDSRTSKLHENQEIFTAAALDESTVLTGGPSRVAVLHDTRTPQESAVFHSESGSIAKLKTQPHGHGLAVATGHGRVHLLDQRKMEMGPKEGLLYHTKLPGYGTTFDLKWTPTGELLIAHDAGLSLLAVGRRADLLALPTGVRAVEPFGERSALFCCDAGAGVGRIHWD